MRNFDSLSFVKGTETSYSSLVHIAEDSLHNYKLTKNKFLYNLTKTNSLLLLSKDKKKTIGFIMGYPKTKKLYHICLFAVLKKYQGKGIGSKLLDLFHLYIKNKGFKNIDTITFNKYPFKIILSLRKGYIIKNFKYLKSKKDYVIVLEKKLEG